MLNVSFHKLFVMKGSKGYHMLSVINDCSLSEFPLHIVTLFLTTHLPAGLYYL